MRGRGGRAASGVRAARRWRNPLLRGGNAWDRIAGIPRGGSDEKGPAVAMWSSSAWSSTVARMSSRSHLRKRNSQCINQDKNITAEASRCLHCTHWLRMTHCVTSYSHPRPVLHVCVCVCVRIRKAKAPIPRHILHCCHSTLRPPYKGAIARSPSLAPF